MKTELNLEALFAGAPAWEKSILPVLQARPNIHTFLGSTRDDSILPARELTFQALKANDPSKWRVIAFGQNPYPRKESATGIAMFDAAIDSWDSKKFGSTTSMRCLIKAAAQSKYKIDANMKVDALRAFIKHRNTVSPTQWFQCLLTQGVLLLNAALTVTSGSSPALSIKQHRSFWEPIIATIIDEILKAKIEQGASEEDKKIVFLWWGNESLKVKTFLTKNVLNKYHNKFNIIHIQHCNPAAQGDLFNQSPLHFDIVNNALGNKPIDWLPTMDWLTENPSLQHEAFITETKQLHQLYLARLQEGIDPDLELAPISGIMKLQPVPLTEACDGLGLKSPANYALQKATDINAPPLTLDQKAAIFLYTGNSLYRRLNDALRSPDRSRVNAYFLYLRQFISAYDALSTSAISSRPLLYRGIRKNLTVHYTCGKIVVWWAVSSCTPNRDVATNFAGGKFGGGTIFHIQSSTAISVRHISAYQAEDEFILAPGTSLQVLSVTKGTQKHCAIILLKELTDKPRLVV
eukprot:CAMPEP_0197295988 /NCGR_PEP_ID=MMETSP0890-20130614/37207_1 /TAXON_ID=44058 ORGANISM="Aureoumbra lagunensis, Strain CCMP1510" /NCGR_SAMPLE_ID=MMETSP0890 /ASSEMBLY_ACC=CAM_ASM_000533 /LENGTH=519 /DNA_ID=CAMNT_0042772287 /DNA_START=13 /DNA_END=1572 /DNA_ORIENTATION=-